jgi:hypothetical protein
MELISFHFTIECGCGESKLKNTTICSIDRFICCNDCLYSGKSFNWGQIDGIFPYMRDLQTFDKLNRLESLNELVIDNKIFVPFTIGYFIGILEVTIENELSNELTSTMHDVYTTNCHIFKKKEKFKKYWNQLEKIK